MGREGKGGGIEGREDGSEGEGGEGEGEAREEGRGEGGDTEPLNHMQGHNTVNGA